MPKKGAKHGKPISDDIKKRETREKHKTEPVENPEVTDEVEFAIIMNDNYINNLEVLKTGLYKGLIAYDPETNSIRARKRLKKKIQTGGDPTSEYIIFVMAAVAIGIAVYNFFGSRTAREGVSTEIMTEILLERKG